MDWSDWRVIRAHFARRLEAAQDTRGLSQTTIAESGGINQNLVSKLLKNYNRGPSVQTFVRALKGLGVKPSEFFAELEGGAPPTPTPPGHKSAPVLPLPPSVDDETAEADRNIGRSLVRVVGKALDEAAKRRRR